MYKLNTTEKIEEFRKVILNYEDIYNAAINAKYYIENSEFNQEELINGLNSFISRIVEETNIIIRPNEIEQVRESVYNIIMRID